MLELYHNIKKYRLQMQLSQDELAKRAGYTDRSSIAKIEKGQVDLPQSKIILFAKIFNIAPGELMGSNASPSELSSDETHLISTYRSLTDPGKKRVRNYASSVLDLESQEQELYAAHHREGVTDISDHDRAIMEDDSEWEE